MEYLWAIVVDEDAVSVLSRSRRPPTSGDAFAAIDLGTHNCRLMIARPAPMPERLKPAAVFSRAVRLGEGLAASGQLSEAAMDRTLDALALFAAIVREHRVAGTRCVATEACRRADNGASFLTRVKETTGFAFDVITPSEEARLTLAGCGSLVAPATDHVLLIDIGGGSTEVSWVGRREDGLHPVATLSLPFGVVTLAERFRAGVLDRQAFTGVLDEVDRGIMRFDLALGISRRLSGLAVEMVGTSGTMTTLGCLSLDLKSYDRQRIDGLTLPFETVHSLALRLATMDPATRVAHPCIGKDRADLAAVGAAVLFAMCRRWPVGRLKLADRGIREGMLLEMMAEAEA